jgi:ADP-ribose pyrophosphatase
MDREAPIHTLAEGRFLRLVRERHWEWVERTNARAAVVILAITTDEQILFVEQHRIPFAAQTIELPAGLVGDEAGQEHEPTAQAARRELLEETGYQVDELTFLGECATSPGLSTETVSFYAGDGARKIAAGGGVDGEGITVHAVPRAACHAWLECRAQAGQIISALVYTALQLRAARQGKR